MTLFDQNGRIGLAFFIMITIGACARPGGEPTSPTPESQTENDSAEEEEEEEPSPPPRAREPIVPPRLALQVGLMPTASTDVGPFLQSNPTYDGRGVVIGILDSGVDLGMPGMRVTTTGQPKVLDARDFSGEGRIALERIHVPGDVLTYGGQRLSGFSRIAGYANPPYYAGLLYERPLGDVPAGDVNGNRNNTDEFVVVVVRTPSGWAVFTDTDSDGTLDDEVTKHDYAVAAETFTYGLKDGEHDEGPHTFAVNFAEEDGLPVLDLFFDNSAHGSHVSGIAAGHNMFDVEGFNGVAPGAQILAIKIANNARGGISVTGSMVRAMNYAANFAQQRGLPLILNMSFGVGNDDEGGAAIDSIVSEFALKHPDVLFVLSAGNEGPGISTLGFPGSAEHILAACALIPGAFSGPRPPGLATDADVIADFSSRGGEVAKPDLCAPGVAFSNVPRWNLGEEVSGGTSMAAPHLSGLAALLQSGRVQDGRPARATDLRQALMASARPSTATFLDRGAGIPRLPAAYAWLMAGHQAGVYSIRAQPDGGNTSRFEAAYRRDGFRSASDTIQNFLIRSVAGQPAASFILRSDQRWLNAPESLELTGGPALVQLTYDSRRVRSPGLYVGTVTATPASDTLAGPAFRLVNTIIVPRTLEQPFVEGRDLGPGRMQRYFFLVPEDAGGLTVEMELRYRTQTGSLFLFEPNGQPFRGESNLEANPGSPTVRMVVRGEDLVPGVYEAVIAAPAASALTYDIRVALPRYVVEGVGTGPSVVIRKRVTAPELIQDAAVFQRESDSASNQTDDVQIQGQRVGGIRRLTITGSGSDVEHVQLEIPEWAEQLVVDVQVPDGMWNQYTDLGVTLFDSSGAQVGLGPLTYGFGRKEFDLSRRHRGRTLDLELFPAFAHIDPPSQWTIDLTLYLIDSDPTDLQLQRSDSLPIVLDAGESIGLQFQRPDSPLILPAGFDPLIEVVATPAGGAPAKRRGRSN